MDWLEVLERRLPPPNEKPFFHLAAVMAFIALWSWWIGLVVPAWGVPLLLLMLSWALVGFGFYEKTNRLRKELDEIRTHDLAAAVLEEREACAQIALGNQISETSLCAEWGRQCAAAIRRRSS